MSAAEKAANIHSSIDGTSFVAGLGYSVIFFVVYGNVSLRRIFYDESRHTFVFLIY